ncbi:MAG: VOC family protein [Propionicimonas sp.]
MTTELLPADTRMSQVALDVADLDAMTRFYSEVLLLEPLREAEGTVALGRGGRELVELRHRPHLPRGERRTAGLFHTALLHPDAGTLATVLASVALRTPQLYTGSGDHLVSQAFYLDDPEGNGVELYVDRPRSEWAWDGDQVVMDTLWLDPNAFLAEHLTDTARNYLETAPDRRPALAGTQAQVVGHVHLKVGQTDRARDFYVDTLGFEVTAELPGALFVSAGGYHHHMAMNTWQTAGIGHSAAASARSPSRSRRPTSWPPPAALRAATRTSRSRSPRVRPPQRRRPLGQPCRGRLRAAATRCPRPPPLPRASLRSRGPAFPSEGPPPGVRASLPVKGQSPGVRASLDVEGQHRCAGPRPQDGPRRSPTYGGETGAR